MATDFGNGNKNREDDYVIVRQIYDYEETKWLDMVASCYAAKGTPREVFENHLKRTPSSERILLAVLDKG